MASVIQLWTANRPMARSIAREFYIAGSDRQDVEQEALIGLWIAARDYKPDLGSFKPFASLVIKRRLVSCVKMANAGKHAPLNQSLRARIGPEGKEERVDELLPNLHQVVDVAENRERLALVIAAIDTDLTEFERRCVVGIATGMEYIELGPYKKVDNALFRARRKLRKSIEAV